MYVILLNKLRFDQISCSGRSGTRWQYGVLKWYEILKRLGTPAVVMVSHLAFLQQHYIRTLDRVKLL